MTSEVKKIKIRELDPDMIAPSTKMSSNPLQGGSKTVIIGKPGCFSKGTPVLMYNGFVERVENVKVGDVVMGDDSTPRNVIELCRGVEDMFNIIPSKGNIYTVNGSHKLVLKNKNTRSVIEISVNNYLKKSRAWQKQYCIYKSPVRFDEKKHGDPYKIGYNILSEYKEAEITKRSSYRNRMELLAGILDVSSIYDTYNRCFEITTINEYLSDSIYFTASSLGFSCVKYNVYGGKHLLTRLCITGDTGAIPTRIIQSNRGIKPQKGNLLYSFRVEPIGFDYYYGFTLDGNHRFLLGTFDVVRNTGKSFLISSLLYEKSHIFPTAMVCSGTEDSNHHYSRIIPPTFIYGNLNKDKVQDFVKRQKIAKEHLENPWAVLLLDDCMDDPKMFNDPLFQGIFKNGRHWKMWFILSLQYCLDVKPVIRTNIDGTFILRETNMRNRRSLWENYAGVIPDFSMFNDIMDQLTTDYTALYIHNATTSNNIEDCVFWYRAKPTPKDFRFGSDEFWGFHEARYDEKHTETFY
jgi:hypothetical protein